MSLNELVDQVSWDTGHQAYGQIEDSIKKVLAERPRPITDPIEVRSVIDRLWRYVTDTIANDPDRNFTKENLESVLSQETLASIDRCAIKELLLNTKETKQSVENIEDSIATLFQKYFRAKHPEGHPLEVIVPSLIERSDRLPPLPKICSGRITVINNISTQCRDIILTWLFGSTGYGKTTLSNLYVRTSQKDYYWFRLSGYSDYTLMAAIDVIKSILFQSSAKQYIVVMDDILLKHNNSYAIEQLIELVDFLRSNNSQLIITSQLSPPANLKSVLGQEICSFDVPEISLEELELLLQELGLVKNKINFWSSYISAMTSGHPQLVNAYITYGKEINWKLSQESLFQKPRSVEEVKTESRKLLMEIIKSDEARELARRLSLVPGFFNRQFALDIGSADPSLKEPGQAFDVLVGPWIEAEAEGYYRLSPLLSGYAEAEFGAENLLNYYKIITRTYLKQKSVNAMQINQIFTSAFMAEEEILIMKICYTLHSMSRDKFKIVAKEISFIRFFYIDTPAKLDWMSPSVKIFFRIIQLKISEINKDLDQFKKIDQYALNELENYRGIPFFNELLLLYYLYTCTIFPSPISIHDRLIRALHTISMVINNLVDQKLADMPESIGNISILFWFNTADIKTIDDLIFFINLIEEQPRDIISELTNGYKYDPETFSFFIERVWLTESCEQTPRWELCDSLFAKIMSFSKLFENEWLFAASARGRMVILDEYLNNPDKALEVAKEARIVLNNSHPMIELGESMIYYRHDNYGQALEIIEKLEKSLPPKILSISRLHSVRRGIICAANLKKWDKIIELGEQGEKIGHYVRLDLLGQLAKIAFKTEVAWVHHEKGEIAIAAEILEQILLESETFENQQYRLFHIFRLRFGHAIGWLGSFWRFGTISPSEEKECKHTKPFSGIFSNLEDPPEESLQLQAPPYNLLWSLIASYAAIDGTSDLVQRCADRSMARIDRGQYEIAVIKAWEALFIKQITEENFEQALYSGLQYSRFLASGSILQPDIDQGKIGFKPIDLEKKFNDLKPESLNRWIESIPLFVLEPILMGLLISKKPLPTAKFRDILEKEVGKIDKINLAVDLIEMVIDATLNDDKCTDNILELLKDKIKVPDDLERIIFIGNCASTSLRLSSALSCQGSLLINVASLKKYSVWCLLFCKLLAKRWLYLAQEQAFLLRSPRNSVPEIVKYASLKIPSLSDCAKLLILVGSSVGLTFPPEMLLAIKNHIIEK